MSYTPTLIIKKKDLEKHKTIFENIWVLEEQNDPDLKVIQYLKDVFHRSGSAKIDDIEIIMCTPEFSVFNENVREKLQEWNVQFGCIN